MVITTKDSILKKYYEMNGQQSMFRYDNLQFKTINHPIPHRFVDLCPSERSVHPAIMSVDKSH